MRMVADKMWQHLEEGTSPKEDDPYASLIVPIIATASTLQGVPVATFLEDASVALPTDEVNRNLP